MTTNEIRTRVLTGCLVTLLTLPAEAVLAQSLVKPGPEFDIPAFWVQPGVSPGQATHDPAIAPWLRNTFVLFRAERTPPMEPTDVSPSTAERAQARATVSAVPVPGTVQNLRPADRL